MTVRHGRHVKHLPFAFTEHGAIMAANILNSPQAVQMSVFVVRAFIKMRSLLTDPRELAKKLAALEKELASRLDCSDRAQGRPCLSPYDLLRGHALRRDHLRAAALRLKRPPSASS